MTELGTRALDFLSSPQNAMFEQRDDTSATTTSPAAGTNHLSKASSPAHQSKGMRKTRGQRSTRTWIAAAVFVL